MRSESRASKRFSLDSHAVCVPPMMPRLNEAEQMNQRQDAKLKKTNKPEDGIHNTVHLLRQTHEYSKEYVFSFWKCNL